MALLMRLLESYPGEVNLPKVPARDQRTGRKKERWWGEGGGQEQEDEDEGRGRKKRLQPHVVTF